MTQLPRKAAFFLVVLLAAPVVWAQEPPQNLFDTLSGREENYLKASEGDAERHGKELIVWLSRGENHERGLIFRNEPKLGRARKTADGSTFVYYGQTPYFAKVAETSGAGTSELYLIERNGRAQVYARGDVDVYATASAQHIAVLKDAGSTSDAPLLRILGVRGEGGASAFLDELRCDLPKMPRQDEQVMMKLGLAKFSDDEISLSVQGVGKVSPLLQTASGNSLRLVRDNDKWKPAQPNPLTYALECK